MRKQEFLYANTKDTNQLHSTIPVLVTPIISSFWHCSVDAQFSVCHTWSETTPKTAVLAARQAMATKRAKSTGTIALVNFYQSTAKFYQCAANFTSALLDFTSALMNLPVH